MPYAQFVILQFINLFLLLSTDPLNESILTPVLDAKSAGIVSAVCQGPIMFTFSNTLSLQLSKSIPKFVVLFCNVKSFIIISLA